MTSTYDQKSSSRVHQVLFISNVLPTRAPSRQRKCSADAADRTWQISSAMHNLTRRRQDETEPQEEAICDRKGSFTETILSAPEIPTHEPT